MVLTTPGLLLPLVLVLAPSQAVMPQVVSVLRVGNYHQTLVRALTLTLLVPLASLIALPVLPRSALLPTTSLMPGISLIALLKMSTLSVSIGYALSDPLMTHTICTLIASISFQPAVATVTVDAPYAASLLPK